MTPEDTNRIVAAIDRNTVEIKTGDTVFHRRSGETWLVAYAQNGYVCACGWPETLAYESDCELIESATEEKRLNLLHELAEKQGHDSRRSYARRILGLTAALFLAIVPVAHATPLLPPLESIVEIGTPPLPPANPNVQYWHTQWVPTDSGVYPQEVYAPALPQVEPELYVFVDIGDPPRLMETPEPGTGILVAGVVFLLIAGGYTAHLLDRAENRELDLKLALIDIKHSNDIERSREIARKALEEK